MGKHSASSSGGGLGGAPWSPRRARRARVEPVRPSPEPIDERPLPRSRRVGLGEALPKPTGFLRERRGQILKQLFLGVLAAAMVLAAAGAAYAFFFVRGVEREMTREVREIDPKITEVLTKPKEPEEPFTILLLGVDKRFGETVARTDTIILARVDTTQKRIWLVSIPRDTRAEIPGKGVDKINVAAYGGYPAVIETVERLMDVEINHFMAVNFRGFQGVVDALGGIWIDVDTEIDDWKAASHSPGHRAKHIEPGYQKLDGEYALTFVRSRDFPDADFARMRHQQAFFKALVKQSARLGNVPKLPGMVKQFSKNVSTDMTFSQILSVASSLFGMPDGNMQTATLSGEWRSPYVYPDEEKLAALSKAINEGGDIEEKPVAPKDIEPAEVTVIIRNGSGYAGVAADAGGRLESLGYKVGDVGNAGQFVYDSTMVIYKTHEGAARAVAADLGVSKVVESRGMYDFGSDVLVVVGRDWQRQAVMNRLTVPED
ncbi:MAG: hypothetical protein C0418_03065 [Coriobacteriaceae bacterium]|nr:hypothetical protein [Coriobacteriaceae bacterium]